MSKAFSEEQEERIRQIVREERNKFALEEMKAIYPPELLQALQSRFPDLFADSREPTTAQVETGNKNLTSFTKFAIASQLKELNTMKSIPVLIELDTTLIDKKIQAVIDAKKALDIAIAELDEASATIATAKRNPAED